MTITIEFDDGTMSVLKQGLMAYGVRQTEDGGMIGTLHLADDITPMQIFLMLCLMDAEMGENAWKLQDGITAWLQERDRVLRMVAEQMTMTKQEDDNDGKCSDDAAGV